MAGRHITSSRGSLNVSLERRGTARQRGYSARWDRYSLRFRKRHPICIACIDTIRSVEFVDHIIPVRGTKDELFWLPWNHQSLCRHHHTEKTHAHDERVSHFGDKYLRLLGDEQETEEQINSARNRLLRELEIWPEGWLDSLTLALVP